MVNEKKQKLRELQQRIFELEAMAEEEANLVRHLFQKCNPPQPEMVVKGVPVTSRSSRQ